ncbi:MAG: DUF2203 domain-containing protein [Candidatus Omnitrophota bacterium]|nr:DUF2203 domain-containing protein [Candidatus Omnitrophota bacterium]
MPKKNFTLQEANRRLPLVKKIVCDILNKGRKLISLADHQRPEGLPVEAAILQAEIEGLISELEDLGCYFKDWRFEQGLVDFPAIINGQEVFLCWRSDEPDIRWYHPRQEGYPSRQLIPSDYLLN